MMTTAAAFWDKIAPKYAKSPISNPEAYEQTLERARIYLGPNTRALELGCGTGSTALKLFQGTETYVATDVAPKMIEIAQAKLTDANQQPKFRVGDVSAAAYSHENFNTVLAFNLLHLLPNPAASLAQIHAILPKDGLFISKSPTLSEKWFYRPLVGAMRLVGKAPPVSFFSIQELDQMITSAGFRIIETALLPPSTPSRFIVARKT